MLIIAGTKVYDMYKKSDKETIKSELEIIVDFGFFV